MNQITPNDLNVIFTYDFFKELNSHINATYKASLSEFLILKSDKMIKKYPEVEILTKSEEKRIEFYKLMKQNASMLDQTAFEEKGKQDQNGFSVYHITEATYNKKVKNVDLNEETPTSDIYIYAQLLDQNGNELIKNNKPLPDNCWSITDDRLLLFIQEYKRDKNGKIKDIITKYLLTKAGNYYEQQIISKTSK